MPREVLVVIRAILPENVITGDVRLAVRRFLSEHLHIPNAQVVCSTHHELAKDKHSTRGRGKSLDRNPHPVRNLRSPS